MVEQDAAPAGGGKRSLRTRAASGTRKQVYAVCANANCYAGGTMTPRQELADGGPHGPSEARRRGSEKGP